MLRVDLRALRAGGAPVSTEGELRPDDPTFQGLDVRLDGPVRVIGALRAVARGAFVWEGRISGRVEGECRRCLAPVRIALETPVRSLFTADPEADDDPSVYPLAEGATALDLRDVVREEVGLAIPSFPLCREDCAGLCRSCGADLNQGACACAGIPEPH